MSGGLDRGVLANEGYGWLLDSSFLGRLGEQDAAAVLARSAWRTLAPGDVLIEAGVEATTVFLLSSGEAQVQVDGRAGWVEIARVGPGHLVGEAAHLKRTRTGARVTAATPVRALTWPAADFAALLVQVPPLTAYVRGLVELRARTERTRDLLRGDPVLRSLGRAEQDRLLQSGSLMHVDAGGTVIAAGERTRDVFLLLEGQVAIFAPPDAQGRGARLGEKGPGWLFGHAAILLGAPRTADVVALTGCELLNISEAAFRELISRDPALHRRLYRDLAQAGVSVVEGHALGGARLLNVWGERPSSRLRILAYGLAGVLRDEGPVVLVDPDLRHTASRLNLRFVEDELGGLPVWRLQAPAPWGLVAVGPRTPEGLTPLLERLTAGGTEGWVVAARAGADVQPPMWDVVVLTRGGGDDGDLPVLHRGAHRVDAHWLDPYTPAVTAPSQRLVRLVTHAGYTASFWRSADVTALGDPRHPPGASVRRLARAVLGRTVGVVLGGGGALGYAHLGLLQALHEADVPVDYVSGVSFGAVVGATYAAGGLPLLEKLVERRKLLRFLINSSMVTFAPFGRWFEALTDGCTLADTMVPFYPVTVDVLSGRETVVGRGPLVDGVRASCAFPGVFDPLRRGGQRLVDGGVANNVPASVAWDAGADFVVASNIIPSFPAGRAPRFGRGLIQAVKDNTIFRVDDLVRSLFLLMSQTGRDRATLADYVFELDVQGYQVGDFDRGDEIRARGLEQARLAIPTILELRAAAR